MRRHGVLIPAHRYAYQQRYGSIPPELHVMHGCDNPICCNPRHLGAGTRSENMQDCVKRGRAKIPKHDSECRCRLCLGLVYWGRPKRK
jgi:hypothetical protein